MIRFIEFRGGWLAASVRVYLRGWLANPHCRHKQILPALYTATSLFLVERESIVRRGQQSEQVRHVEHVTMTSTTIDSPQIFQSKGLGDTVVWFSSIFSTLLHAAIAPPKPITPKVSFLTNRQ